MRNITTAYEEAPPELKRVYLSIFWSRFELSDRKLVNAIPSPIVEALLASGTAGFSNKHKPIPLEKRFAQKNEIFREHLRIRNVGGPRRDLNFAYEKALFVERFAELSFDFICSAPAA